MKVSKSSIAGWVLSSLLAALLIVGSASGKFTEWEGKADMFAKLGWSAEVMFRIGLVEVACAILFVAAILLTGYLGGATATHIRVGDPFHMPVIIGVVVWTSLGLRDPRIFSAAFQKQPSRRTTSSEE